MNAIPSQWSDSYHRLGTDPIPSVVLEHISSVVTILILQLSANLATREIKLAFSWQITLHSSQFSMVNIQTTLWYNNNLVAFIQGNADFLECGTITGGPCNRDELWGVGTFQADDQEGCSCKGIRGCSGLFRKIVIKGKCASRCSLVWAVESWATPINNWGLVKESS